MPSSSSKPAKQRLQQYKGRYSDITRSNVHTKSESSDEIEQYLARRAFHLPGGNCCSDWIQYIVNTHPVLGICCHHKAHPVGAKMRLVVLLGSFVFGLAMSCMIWSSMEYHDYDPESVVFQLNVKENENDDEVASSYSVTKYMLALWTVGSGVHSLYDHLLWHITACACFQNGGCCDYEACGFCRSFGNYIAIFIVVLVTIIATCSVLLRGVLESVDDVDMEDYENYGTYFGAMDFDSFAFLPTYLIEVTFAQLYHPITGTLLFSGILGCGRIPVLGGRPFEMRRERAKKQQASSDYRQLA